MRELKTRREELLERIRKTKELRRKIINRSQELVLKYRSGEIRDVEYKKELEKSFEKRTAQEWTDYYSKCIIVYYNHLEDCERRIREKRKSFWKIIFAGMMIGIFGLIVFLFYPKGIVLFAPGGGNLYPRFKFGCK